MKFKITKKNGYTNIEVSGGGDLRLFDKKIAFEVDLLNKTYPVGALYLSINATSPASLFGGTWEKLPEGYALWTATNGAGGTIAAGLPNITGNLWGGNRNGDSSVTGAFKQESTQTPWGGGGSGAGINFLASFNASRVSDIYGKSSTVQPPAYKIYAWKRIS